MEALVREETAVSHRTSNDIRSGIERSPTFPPSPQVRRLLSIRDDPPVAVVIVCYQCVISPRALPHAPVLSASR